MKHLTGLLTRNSHGFTLVETVTAAAIAGIIIAGAAGTIIQTLKENERATTHMEATRQVENAGFWISRDGLRSQTIAATGSAFPITLTWQDWDGNTHEVVYTLSGGTLSRALSVNGGPSTQTAIAQSIDPDPAKTNCTYTGGILTLNIASSVDGTSETRTYTVKARPEMPA